MRVSLNGYVVSDNDQWLYDWFEIGAFSPEVVRRAIDSLPEGEELILEINSPGGSVFAGGEIYTVLWNAAQIRPIHAEIQSLAASAASYLCLGCTDVSISPVALMMIHLPTTVTEGDRTEHLRSVELMDKTRDAILNAYDGKSAGRTNREEFRRMMNRTTWMTAQEAVELGLADRILGQEDGKEPIPENIINAAGAGIRAITNASGPVWDRASLLERYERLVRDGAKPAEGHPVESASSVTADAVPPSPKGEGFGLGCLVVDTAKLEPGTHRVTVGTSADWRAQARLELERNRFLNIGGYKNG